MVMLANHQRAHNGGYFSTARELGGIQSVT